MLVTYLLRMTFISYSHRCNGDTSVTDLKIFPSNAQLPADLGCQIHAFIRITWFDIFQYDLQGEVMPKEWHPCHVVATEKGVVFSYAGVVWQNKEHNGQQYKVYGLSSVFSYPAFRKKGYGGQVVEAATKVIAQSGDADLAILFTDPELEHFYARYGWQHVPNITILTGNKAAPEVYGAFTMALFVSDKGKQAQKAFEQNGFYFGEHGW
jgi:GNAT superfamily N-acetyltransferase